MLKKEELIEIIREISPEAEITEGSQFPEILIPEKEYFSVVKKLKTDNRTCFDYLIDHTAIDNVSHFMIVNHLESTTSRNLLVVKVKLEGRDTLIIDSISEVFPAAEFFEREVFDLFGIKYKNHPNLKRLFLEEEYGYPLRKDFKDEINFIER